MDLLQIHCQTAGTVQMEGLVLLSSEYPQLPLGAHVTLKEKDIWLNGANFNKPKQTNITLCHKLIAVRKEIFISLFAFNNQLGRSRESEQPE